MHWQLFQFVGKSFELQVRPDAGDSRGRRSSKLEKWSGVNPVLTVLQVQVQTFSAPFLLLMVGEDDGMLFTAI